MTAGTSKLRILCVACDGIGLGHVSRQIGIARNVRQLCANAEILFLTSSEAASVIWHEGFASVKLPSLELDHHPEAHRISLGALDKIAPSVIDGVLQTFRPTVTVVDTFPTGFRGEYGPILRFPTRRVLVQRQLSTYEAGPHFIEILNRYDAIVAPYNAREVALTVPPEKDVQWAGPILVRNSDEVLSRDAARAALGLPAEGPVCLLSFGGGGHKNAKAIDGWFRTVIAQHPNWHFVVPSPPLSDSRRKKPYPDSVSQVTYYPLMEYLRAFDVAVVGSGSLQIELASVGVPTVVLFDREKLDEEQAVKAALYSSDGTGMLIDQFDSAALCSHLAALEDPSVRTNIASALIVRHGTIKGAAKAARTVLSLCEPSAS